MGVKLSGENLTMIWQLEEVKFDSDFSLEKQDEISTVKKTRFARKDHNLHIEHVELDGFVKSVRYLGLYLGGKVLASRSLGDKFVIDPSI